MSNTGPGFSQGRYIFSGFHGIFYELVFTFESYAAVTFGRISPMAKERAASVGVQHCLFNALSVFGKYASCSLPGYVHQKFVLSSICPERARFSRVLALSGDVCCSVRPSVTAA